MKQNEVSQHSNPEGVQNSGGNKHQAETLSHILEDVERNPEALLLFEIRLALAGLMPRLEQARIVPAIEDPNPYDAIDEIEAHEKWWLNHPEASQTFLQLIEKRNEVLRIMYVGACIGAGPWRIP